MGADRGGFAAVYPSDYRINQQAADSEVTPKQLAASAQIVGFAIYFGISGFLTPVIGAWLVERFDFNITCWIFACIAIIPTWMIIKMRKVRGISRLKLFSEENEFSSRPDSVILYK